MTVKIKDEVSFESLKDFGFDEDPYNCEEGDVRYHLNNWYLEIGDFRITVSTLDKRIDILCLAKETVLYNMFDIKPLYQLLVSGLVEVD